jgi:hypothetical protein
MRRKFMAATLAGLVVAVGFVGAADEAKGNKVEYQIHNGYFESNKSGLKGDASFLAIADQKKFDETFGKAVVMGGKPNFLPKDAFDSRLVVATIKRGNSTYEYKVDKVTADEGTLYVQYEATAKGGGGTATFATPLIIAVDKGKDNKYTKVVFIENGKKVGETEIGK